MKKDWNETIKNWNELSLKLLSIEKKLKKSRRKDINRVSIIKHINDCTSMIVWEIRRNDIEGADNGIKETNKLLDKGVFAYYS
jgi:hypothetical protein